MNRLAASGIKRGNAQKLAGPDKRFRSSIPDNDWLDLPTHLPNTLPITPAAKNAPPEATDNTTTNTVKPFVVNDNISAKLKDGVTEASTSSATSELQLLEVSQHEDVAQPIDAKPAEPIYIEGTSISLQTDEDIAKWIEERKKNWPTRKNIAAKAERLLLMAPSQPEKSAERKKPVCRFFAKSGRCKFGNKCKNSHENNADSSAKVINGVTIKVPQRYKNSASGGSLFKNLVQRDLFQHENELVLDFVKYLQNNAMIDLNAHP